MATKKYVGTRLNTQNIRRDKLMEYVSERIKVTPSGSSTTNGPVNVIPLEAPTPVYWFEDDHV